MQLQHFLTQTAFDRNGIDQMLLQMLLAGAIFFAAALGAALVRAVAGVVLRVAMAGFSVSCKQAIRPSLAGAAQ